ncbi:MAG: RNA polymerase sigma factor, partial [Gammaproteobacteria bacterium]
RREVGLSDCFDAGSSSAPHSAVERALDYREVFMALSQLTQVQEQVIVLRFLKDLDVATVARTLGRSESAVKSLQFRALTSLRRIMQGIEATGAPENDVARDPLAVAG